MNNKHPLNVVTKLQQLFSLLQQGKTQLVINEVDILLVSSSNNSDVMHLAAMAHKANKEFDKAIGYFNKSLTINNNQAQVHNNLANTYKQNQKNELAERHYKKAIDINPKYVDALKNLGLLYLNIKKYSQAIKTLLQAFQLAKRDVSVLTSLGNAYKAQHEYTSAIKYYQLALTENPNYVNALHNLGISYRLSGQLLLAIECFKKAQVLAPNISELDYNEANTQFDLGNYEAAEQAYWKSLAKAPDNCEVHETLNEFYWQVGRKNDFGRSFKLAIEHLPDNIALRQAYAESLLSAGNSSQALKVVEDALVIKKNPNLLHFKGKLLASHGEVKASIVLIETSLTTSYSLLKALDLIELLIIDFQYEKALHYISYAETIAPRNQLLIAHKSLCWRLTHDERYEWLIDYQKYIGVYDIPVPKGYSSKSAFLDELKGVLLAMHQTQHEPLKQTLKHGTQTPGRLFYKPIKQITDLKNAFEELALEYISSLPDDDSHPLLSRKSRNVSFAGSWSVKLRPNGFHVNHVHPEGWLSSCFYVHVPNFDSYLQSSVHAGAIKFGESSMNLGKREKITRIVKPEAGLVAIFPSYVWHGTFAFSAPDDVYRLTAPCDITPIGN